jgi:hypothetical protein
MTQIPPTSSPLGPGTDTATQAQELLYGIPSSSQGAQFLLEEEAAGAARGTGNPFAGWKMPAAAAGDFWQLYSQAETFAANTGWRNLLTPQQLIGAWHAGMATADQTTLFAYFARVAKVDTAKMPWAATGLNATQYAQATNNLKDAVFALTGKDDFASAGLGGVETQALSQGWTQQHLSDYIQKNAGLNAQYGWLQHGLDYQGFAQYKIQNADTLKSRYGAQFTDQQTLANLTSPLGSFHAQGGAFGQQVPFVAADSKLPTGQASAVR